MTVGERHEDLPDERLEDHGGEQGDPLARRRRHAVALGQVRDAVNNAAVRFGDALGIAGRAGRVGDVGRRSLSDGEAEVSVREFLEAGSCRELVEGDDGGVGAEQARPGAAGAVGWPGRRPRRRPAG